MRSLLILGVAVMGLLTGCGRVPQLPLEVETAGTAPLRLAALSTSSPQELHKAYAGLLTHLSRAVGREVELVVTSTHEELAYLTSAGHAEVTWFPGSLYEQVKVGLRGIAIARVSRGGSTSYRGVILVRADAPQKKVEDLKGCKFAYVDRHSGSGFGAANQLMVDAGLDPLRDLGSVAFTASQRVSVLGLVDGTYDAIAVFEGVLDTVARSTPAAKLRVLATSRPIPSGVITVSPDVPESVRLRLKQTLLDVGTNPVGKSALDQMRSVHPVDAFVDVE